MTGTQAVKTIGESLRIKRISFTCCLCLCTVNTPIHVHSQAETIEIYCGNGHPHLLTIQDGWITAITLNMTLESQVRQWIVWKLKELISEHEERKNKKPFGDISYVYEKGFIDCAESVKRMVEQADSANKKSAPKVVQA